MNIDINIPAVKHTISHMTYVKLFEGATLSFDEEFRQLCLHVEGYEIIIEKGNSENWVTKSKCGGFNDGAWRLTVVEEDDFEEERPLIDQMLPFVLDQKEMF
jgi:hypothetical protein